MALWLYNIEKVFQYKLVDLVDPFAFQLIDQPTDGHGLQSRALEHMESLRLHLIQLYIGVRQFVTPLSAICTDIY